MRTVHFVHTYIRMRSHNRAYICRLQRTVQYRSVLPRREACVHAALGCDTWSERRPRPRSAVIGPGQWGADAAAGCPLPSVGAGRHSKDRTTPCSQHRCGSARPCSRRRPHNPLWRPPCHCCTAPATVSRSLLWTHRLGIFKGIVHLQ